MEKARFLSSRLSLVGAGLDWSANDTSTAFARICGAKADSAMLESE
jgi:hypothetical protein